ncbi:MAG: CRISPR-associated protein Csx3 [Patescibacteria group bacterium]
MATYRIETSNVNVGAAPATLFKIGFADPATTDVVVRDAEARIKELEASSEMGGAMALTNGPAALPVAMVLAHHLAHRYAVVACFDPKCAGYIVAISHGDKYHVGDLILASDVL